MVRWVFDLVTEILTGKVVATVFHIQDNTVNTLDDACVQHIEKELRLEGNEHKLSRQFDTLKEAQAHWYKTTKQTDMIKGLD